MSHFVIDHVTCENCHHVNDYTHYHTINVAMEPELKQKILDDSIFTYTCPDCGFTKNYHHPLFYYDPEHHLIIEYSADYDQFLHFISMFHQYNVFDRYTIRWTDNWYTFKETIQIVDHERDDRIIAMYKKLLLDDFSIRNPDCGTAMVLYDATDVERLIVISEYLEPHIYAFPENWYTTKLNSPLVQKALKYDITFKVDNDYALSLINMDISIQIADVRMPLEQKGYILTPYDDAYIGNRVLVDTLHSKVPVEGVIQNIFTYNIRDIPFGIKTIRCFLNDEEERDDYSPFFASNHAQMSQSDVYTLLEILMDTFVYVPMSYKDKTLATMAIELNSHRPLIPLYTSKNYCPDSEDVLYFKDTFEHMINQHVIIADGFVLNPNKPEFLVVDDSLISLYNDYKKTHQYTYS